MSTASLRRLTGDRLDADRRTRSPRFGYGPMRRATPTTATAAVHIGRCVMSQLSILDPVDGQIRERTSRPDFDAWLRHVKPAAGCVAPIRLYGDLYRVKVNQVTGTWCVLSHTSTQDMPESVIYKPCGNRRVT